MQNSTYVLLDTTGAPGSNLLASTLTATTQFGVTTTAQVAWVFLPNPTYGYRIVNVSFPAKTNYGAGTVFCDVYNADGAGSVGALMTTGAVSVATSNVQQYWRISMWPYVYIPPVASAQPGYAIALRATAGTNNLVRLTVANPGVNYGILQLKNVWTGATAGTFTTNAWNSVANAGTMYAAPVYVVGVTLPTPSQTPSATASISGGASPSGTPSPTFSASSTILR